METPEIRHRLTRVVEIALEEARYQKRLLDRLRRAYDEGDLDEIHRLAGALLGDYDLQDQLKNEPDA